MQLQRLSVGQRPRVGLLLAAAGFVLVSLGCARSLSQEGQGAERVSIVSNDGTYRVQYDLEPDVIEFGELFSLTLWPERVDGEEFASRLAVDARMPEHAHGMNREPKVERREDGSLRVTNLFFHMPGYWEIYFDFTRGAITERAQFPVDVD